MNFSANPIIMKDHIHITLITVYFYNCSILLLVVVNLLLYLISKLNFIIVYIGLGTIRGFRRPVGVLECIPLR